MNDDQIHDDAKQDPQARAVEVRGIDSAYVETYEEAMQRISHGKECRIFLSRLHRGEQ